MYLANGFIIFLGFVATDALGDWSLTATVPADPFLECLPITVQAFLLPASPPPFYQVTDGLGLVLGY
jgi:hypothetical protein